MSFECLKNCGVCCCPVPIPRKVYEENKDKIPANFDIYLTEQVAIIVQPGGACGFLSEEKTCRIYADRPEVCRLFGDSEKSMKDTRLMCPFMRPDGTPRRRPERRALQQVQKRTEKKLMRELRGTDGLRRMQGDEVQEFPIPLPLRMPPSNRKTLRYRGAILREEKSMKPPLQNGSPDDFQTPAHAIEPLLPFLKKEWLIWECACGKGNLVDALNKRGRLAIGTDIMDGHDFLTWRPDKFDCIVTNPPFSLKDEFLNRAGRPFSVSAPARAAGVPGLHLPL